MFIYHWLTALGEDTMTERPQQDTMAPLVPEMPQNRVRTDGGRIRSAIAGAKYVDDEADAPLVPDLS